MAIEAKQNQMQVTYEQTLEDIAAFNLHHFRTSKRSQRRLLLSQALLIFSTSVAAMIWPGWSFIERVVFFVVFSLLSIFGYPMYYRWAIKRNAKKIYAAAQSQGILGEHTLTLGAEGFATSCSANDSRVSWSGVERIDSDEQYIYIYTSPLQAHVIPKRAFSSDEEASSFMQAAERFRADAI